MTKRHSRKKNSLLIIPRRLRPPMDIDAERDSLSKEYEVRTVGLLGRAITLKTVEFVPGFHNPGADAALDFIVRGIELACDKLGLDTVAGTIPGVTPTVGISAASMDFFGAGTAIIGTLATFADRLSTLLAQSIIFDPTGSGIVIDDEKCIRRIRANPDLRGQWERFVLHGAGIFFKNEPPDTPLDKRRRQLKIELMSAMELFGLAHEYGLHMAQHGRGESCQERQLTDFERDVLADEIAWSIGRFLGKRCFAGGFLTYRNTWIESGAGAVALLSSALVVRCAREIMETGTYSNQVGFARRYQDRLEALESWSGYADDPLRKRFIYQRSLIGRLVPRIFNELKVRFWAGHNVGFRPTSTDTLRKSIGDSIEGLVDILTKETSGTELPANSSAVESFAKYVGSSPSALTANSVALEDALRRMRGEAGGLPIIADQYLKHYQDKSVQQFAVSVIRGKIGTVDPTISSSVSDRLRVGRTDGTRAGLQDVINIYSVWIEPVCRKLNLPLHGGVVCGIGWNPTSSPAQLSVSDGESIVLVPESSLMLCHFISKLLVKLLSIKVEGGRLAVNCDCEKVLRKLTASEKLKNYATGGLTYCATWNRRLLKPLPPTSGDQRVLWYQLLMSVELFVVAHEYAHHILQHGASSAASVAGPPSEVCHEQELEADYYAALLSAHVGLEERLSFAQDSAAAVIALIAVDILRRTRDVLATGAEIELASSTHPSLGARLLNLDTLRYDPRQADAIRGIRRNFTNIMEGIWTTILPRLKAMHENGVRPLPAGQEESHWLPFHSSSGTMFTAA